MKTNKPVKKTYNISYFDSTYGALYYIQVSGEDALIVIALLGSNQSISLRSITEVKV